MSGLNLDELLKEMQAFFHGYAHVVPSPKSDDKPSRTAKTILFHLTEHMGAEVSGCVGVHMCVCVLVLFAKFELTH